MIDGMMDAIEVSVIRWRLISDGACRPTGAAVIRIAKWSYLGNFWRVAVVPRANLTQSA